MLGDNMLVVHGTQKRPTKGKNRENMATLKHNEKWENTRRQVLIIESGVVQVGVLRGQIGANGAL